MELADHQCTACRPGQPHVSAADEETLLRELPGWEIVPANDVRKLRRTFTPSTWLDGIAFAGRVGQLAEEADHHPTITIIWGKVTVTWWTHAIRGLHRNDFIMASRTDRVFTGVIAQPVGDSGC